MSDINVQTFSGKVNVTNNLLVGSSHLFVDTVGNKVGITTASPDAGLHVNSNAYVNTDFRVGSSIIMNDTAGQITAGSFVGDGSAMTGINSDSGSWVNGTGNVYLSTTTDKVGIGTSDPPCLLTIDGGTGVDSSGGVLCIKQKGDTVNDGITLTSSHANSTRMYKDANGHFNLHNTGGGSFLFENVTGNIGIGGRVVGLLAPLHVSIPGGRDYGGYTNTPLDMSKDMFRIGNRIANNPTYDDNEYGIQFGVSGSGNSSIQTYVYNHGTTSTTASYSLLLQPNGGNVGIGTTSPENKLHIHGETNAIYLQKSTNNNGIGIMFTDNKPSTGAPSQLGYLRYYHSDGYSFGTQNCFRLSSSEDTETLALGGCLHIGVDGKDDGYMTNTAGSGRRNLFIQSTFGGNTSQNYGWWIGAQNQGLSSTDNDLYFAVVRSGTIKLCGTMLDQNNANLNFTGQHRTFVKDTPTNQLDDKEGLIVVADQNEFIKMSGGVARGNEAITINESLPVVSLATKVKDKKCFGVLSTTEDPETRKEVHGNFASLMQKEEGDTRVYVNSVGEGAIWVTNVNGTLESGDYITTSNVVGYGMKQNDDILHNYTVAKILMDCDFNPPTQVKRVIKKESRMVDYWIRYGDVKINEEEYQSLPETKRKIVEDVHYRIDQMDVRKEDPEKDTFVYEQREEFVNVLDEHGQIQWEDSGETEAPYKVRYLLPDGTQISEDEYTTRALADEKVYIAAFVGCTYHCG